MSRRGKEAGVESPALAARGVTFSHAGPPLFDRITLKLEPGEMAAILGPNGSGKTTLLRLLGGSLRPAEGSIVIGGQDAAVLSPRARALRVAIVPQDTTVTFDFTVMETVLMGRTPHLGPLGLEGPEDLLVAREALRLTGLTSLAGRTLSRLSGGERQLAVIARALAQKPRVLLLDEPTSHLDIRHRLAIYDLLGRLHVEEGLTILTTSHDINLAARYCPRLLLLRAGRIVADGPPAEVMRAEILSEVYETPLSVIPDPFTGLPCALPDGRPGERGSMMPGVPSSPPNR